MLGESLLILFWLVLVSIILFFVVGKIIYKIRMVSEQSYINGNESSTYTIHVIEFLAFLAIGFILALGFIYSYAFVKNNHVKTALQTTEPLTLVADKLKRPTSDNYVNNWFATKVGPAFSTSAGADDLGQDQFDFINAVVVSNKDAEEKIPTDNSLIKTLALSPTLSPVCNNLVDTLFSMMKVYNENLVLPDIKASHTACPSFMLGDESLKNRRGIRQYFEKKIVPDSSLSSLLFNTLTPLNPTTLRLEMLSKIRPTKEEGARNVLDDFANKTAKDKENALHIIKIVDAMIEMMLTATEKDRRIVAIIWGPIQLLTLTLFFCGLLILAERHFNLSDLHSRFNKHLHSGSTREQLITDLEEVVTIPVNYILWALPTLGFIGTVTGISAAISDAYKVALFTDPIAQGGAIKWVTSLLGVAFDTTFLALICSLPLMALAFLIRSQEMIRINEK